MGILRTDRVSGLGGANAIKGSTKLSENRLLEVHGAESNEDFRLSNGSFTIEFWAYIADTSNSTFVALFENNPARRSWQFEARSNQALRFEWWTDGSSGTSLTSQVNSFIRERWHHFAAVRNGTALNIYVDGTSVANTTTSDTLYENTIEPLTIGGIFQSGALTQDITGFISNLRIIKGEAIYTANFTPPTSELTVTSNTVVLACQSPGNVLQEATGKTIVATTTSTNDAPPEASHFTPNSPVGFSTTSDVGTQFGSTFDGVTTFDSQAYFVPPGGNTRERNRGVGLYAGGTTPSTDPTAQIASILIQSLGNSIDFGDLSVARYPGGTGASATRGIWAGGATPTRLNTIDFVTIANSAKAIDFGDTQNVAGASAGVSNSTRMVNAGGDNPSPTLASVNVMDLIIIATAGNGSDFGDLSVARATHGAAASPTRGLFAGGWTAVPAYTPSDTIDLITIASASSATDFGNLTTARRSISGGSSQTRAIFMGGKSGSNPSSTKTNIIDFVTIASTGDATDFGDLTATVRDSGNTMSNSIRACKAAGYNSPATVNSIDMVTIATTGNAVDFGDTVVPVFSPTGLSDSHGGLS